MSDVRIIDTPRIEADFTETDTTAGDYKAAIEAHARAVAAAHSLGWKQYRVVVIATSEEEAYGRWTVSLERNDEPQ